MPLPQFYYADEDRHPLDMRPGLRLSQAFRFWESTMGRIPALIWTLKRRGENVAYHDRIDGLLLLPPQ